MGFILFSNEIVVWIFGIVSVILGLLLFCFKVILIPLSCIAPKTGLYYVKLFDKDEYKRLRENYQTADTSIYKREWLRSTDWEQIY